ncbi:MAG: glycoside hydrolase family 44 protein [Anaerolineae bacterium]
MHSHPSQPRTMLAVKKYAGITLVLTLLGLFALLRSSAETIQIIQAEEQTGFATYTLSVDTRIINHEISPYIYGVNLADYEMGDQLNLPINRYGGNSTSRYNWKTSSTNLGHNWYFLNNARGSDSASLPNGSVTDLFVEQNQSTGTESLLTVPLMGWVSKSRDLTCGFSVSKYGQQDQVEPWHPNCGNGTLTDKSEGDGRILWSDPTDTSVAVDETFVQEWIEHLNGRYGSADRGGVRFYSMDNEPMLWFYNHQDVHPEPVSYDEIRDKTYQYAPAVKESDPAAEIIGPSVWGWNAYFTSAVDQEHPNGYVDKAAHGGTPFLEWYLQQMSAYEVENGTRILDYLDLHYYPQALGVTLSSAGDLATQERRLRSTRSLWDSAYQDESWINQPVYLVPRMHGWVNDNYPDTKLSISEYNFGGLEHINGAVTQADVLGIFGRENLHMALMWGWLNIDASEPWAYAFRMYRNYDGQKSTFGDQSVLAVSSNEWDMATFAARRSSDNALTIMVINKTFESATAQVELTGLISSEAAEVYQYSQSDLANIKNLGKQPVDDNLLIREVPAQSITLFVIKKGVYALPPAPTPVPTSTPMPTSPSAPALPTATPAAPTPIGTATPPPDDDPLPSETVPPPVATPPTTSAYRWHIQQGESHTFELGWVSIYLPSETFAEDVFLELDFPAGFRDPGDKLSTGLDSYMLMQFSLAAYDATSGKVVAPRQNKRLTVSLATSGKIYQQIVSETANLYVLDSDSGDWKNVPFSTRNNTSGYFLFEADQLETWALISNNIEIYLPQIEN